MILWSGAVDSIDAAFLSLGAGECWLWSSEDAYGLDYQEPLQQPISLEAVGGLSGLRFLPTASSTLITIRQGSSTTSPFRWAGTVVLMPDPEAEPGEASVGTVTSVDLSMPAIFSVRGGPITGSGVIEVKWEGLSTDLVLGDGTTLPTDTFALSADLEAYEAWAAAHYQPVSAELTAIAGLSSAGYVKRTGPGAYSVVASIPKADVAGLVADLAGKEPTIAAGTTAQYRRGDKTWQTLNTAAVPESGNLYYTDARARAAMVGNYLPLAAGASNPLSGELYAPGVTIATTTNFPLSVTLTNSDAFSAPVKLRNPALPIGGQFSMEFGTADSDYNSGHFGFVNAGGAGSPGNYLTFGLWGANGLLRLYGNGNVYVGSLGTGFVRSTSGILSSSSLNAVDVSTALGYTPLRETNPTWFGLLKSAAGTLALEALLAGGLIKATYGTGVLALATGADIPDLDASKITTGAFPDGRIASAATWNAKVGGSGTTNYIPRFTGSGTTLGNSAMYDNGTTVYSDRQLAVNGAAGTSRMFWFTSATVGRWAWNVAGAELGSDAGAYIELRAYADGGGYIDAPFAIGRAAGSVMQLKRPVNLPLLTASTMLKLDSSKLIVSASAGTDYLAPSAMSGTSGQLTRFTGANTVGSDGGWRTSQSGGLTYRVLLDGSASTATNTEMVLSTPNMASAYTDLSWSTGAYSGAPGTPTRRITARWEDSVDALAIFSSTDAGGARSNRLRIYRSDSTPVRAYLGLDVASGNFQVGGVDTITSSRGALFMNVSVDMGASDSLGSGSYVQVRNGTTPTMSWAAQLGASNTYDLWNYASGAWTKRVSIASGGIPTFTALTGGATRLATLSASGVLGATTFANDGPWLPLTGGTVDYQQAKRLRGVSVDTSASTSLNSGSYVMVTRLTGAGGQAMTLNPGSDIGEVLIVLPNAGSKQVIIAGTNTLIGSDYYGTAGKAVICIWAGAGWTVGQLS